MYKERFAWGRRRNPIEKLKRRDERFRRRFR